MKRSLKNMNITWEEAEWRQRVAQYYTNTTRRRRMNRTEQNNRIVFFILYFENTFGVFCYLQNISEITF